MHLPCPREGGIISQALICTPLTYIPSHAFSRSKELNICDFVVYSGRRHSALHDLLSDPSIISQSSVCSVVCYIEVLYAVCYIQVMQCCLLHRGTICCLLYTGNAVLSVT